MIEENQIFTVSNDVAKDAMENKRIIVCIDVDGTETIVGYTKQTKDINHFILKE